MKTFVKVLLAAAMITFAAVGASAQEKKIHFGVKAGVNFSTLNYDNYKNNLGYQAGLAMQFDLPAWFSIEPDLLFHIKGVQDKEADRSQGLGYIELPINVQFGPSFYNDNMRVYIQAGPYLGYAVSKDIKSAADAKNERTTYDWANINRFEYGAGVGLGIKLFAFQLSAEYTWNFGTVASDKAIADFPKIFNQKNFSGFLVNLAIIF